MTYAELKVVGLAMEDFAKKWEMVFVGMALLKEMNNVMMGSPWKVEMAAQFHAKCNQDGAVEPTTP